MQVQALGYLGFGSADLDGWSEFATSLLGMQAAEQAVVRILATAKASLWSLRQLRLGLRQGRQALIDEWGKGAKGAWYRAVKTCTGCKVTEIKDWRQREIEDWRGLR